MVIHPHGSGKAGAEPAMGVPVPTITETPIAGSRPVSPMRAAWSGNRVSAPRGAIPLPDATLRGRFGVFGSDTRSRERMDARRPARFRPQWRGLAP